MTFLLITILLSSKLFPQEYLWPVLSKKEITAVFGEERPGRYHTGIDIRTFGEIGLPLIAIENGYISRIRTSSKGYGKTLYLKLNDGNTAVYAHLDHFNPRIEKLALSLYKYYNKYTLDHKFDSSELPIKKGEIIGFSGDTGGVSGPHLHFEIRNEIDQPINPFKYSFSLEDNIPPTVNSLALIPLNRKSYINGISEEQIFTLTKINDHKYLLEDTISVWGKIGIAVNTYDQINNQEFNYGIYSIDFLQNAQFIYSMQYDKMDWNNANFLYTEKSYSLARKGNGKFHQLFSSHNNQKLPFVNSMSQNGFNYNQSEIHDAIINIRDYANNKVEINAFFYSDTIPKYNYSTHFKDEGCLVKFDTEKVYKPFFYINNKSGLYNKKNATYKKYDNNIYLITNLNYETDVLEIFVKNQSGHKSNSTFHVPPINNYYDINGKIQINHYEHGLIIKFIENTASGLIPYLILNNNDLSKRIELNSTSLLEFSSKILSPLELENTSEIQVYYDKHNPYQVFSANQWGTIIYPDSTYNFNLINDQIKITISKETFYDTTYFWVKPIKINKPKNATLMSKAYKIYPNLIPYNKDVKIEIKLNNTNFPKHVSIYYFNEEKKIWNIMPTKVSLDSTYLTTKILSGEIFAIIKETTPPLLTSFIPSIKGTYYASDITNISFLIKDDFAGIEVETDVIMKLDKEKVIFEYNSYQNKIKYPLIKNLKKGEHSLYVEAIDKVGNKSIVEGVFFIK